MRNIVFIVIAFVLSFSGRVCAGNPVYYGAQNETYIED